MQELLNKIYFGLKYFPLGEAHTSLELSKKGTGMSGTASALILSGKYPSLCNKNVICFSLSPHDEQSYGVGHKPNQFPQNIPQSHVQGINIPHVTPTLAPSSSV